MRIPKFLETVVVMEPIFESLEVLGSSMGEVFGGADVELVCLDIYDRIGSRRDGVIIAGCV